MKRLTIIIVFIILADMALGQGIYYIPLESERIEVSWNHSNPPNKPLDGFCVYVEWDSLLMATTVEKQMEFTPDQFPGGVWPDSIAVSVDAWNQYGRSGRSDTAYALFRNPPPFELIMLNGTDLLAYGNASCVPYEIDGGAVVRMLLPEPEDDYSLAMITIPVTVPDGRYEAVLLLHGVTFIMEIADFRHVFNLNGRPGLWAYRIEFDLAQGDYNVLLYPEHHTGFIGWFEMRRAGEDMQPPARPVSLQIEWE